MQKKRPPLEALVIAKHIKLVQAAKAFLEQQGFKGNGKAKALMVDSEETGPNNSDKEEEEERVHVIKRIKHKHVEEPIGMRKGKEIIELENLKDEMVAPKTPMAELLHQTLKPMVLIPSISKSVPKPIVALASSVAGPSTAPIVLSLASKPTAAVPVSRSATCEICWQFKLAGTEESSALIINQVTEVAAGKVTSTAIQETLQSEEV
ncbi:hypothetical protein C0995_015674 [Termitomyces sp. Mi166|nr:hypothetical protein C0995_015674 [Termitomyces sp. Mi166\